jgi:gliding motility-associated lipoprotein GldH
MTAIRLFFALITLSALFAACGPDFITEQRHEIGNSGRWMYADTCDFTFQINDTASLYNFYLDIEAADTFSTQNIYLQLSTTFPDKKRIHLERSFDIYDLQGNALGKCSGGTCTQRVMLQERAFFNLPGQYVVTVGQWMRADALPGIRAVGLTVERLKEQRK